ncbi:hypothetical protein Tb927.4.2090 [Trypanosoma brucei brucei TREU927]|uniref:Transmembrane protein n=1 Tax=Trypanosoma brucei brucei (strain 927/4 GUTat10.1) TaxID=185431 RepID=Q583I4_TRYB2|nr:hypothetical protein Tb927.4.2090 [Trypanosoma brucei brucei TREU927]AAX79765.1 hypothetical protein Tb927.4.2090 [Trypanosoma brucei]AAZ10800.1 hypothetical protein Tb927.4.2090 [Trypanosoma brucei brucei TREU927]
MLLPHPSFVGRFFQCRSKEMAGDRLWEDRNNRFITIFVSEWGGVTALSTSTAVIWCLHSIYGLRALCRCYPFRTANKTRVNTNICFILQVYKCFAISARCLYVSPFWMCCFSAPDCQPVGPLCGVDFVVTCTAEVPRLGRRSWALIALFLGVYVLVVRGLFCSWGGGTSSI